MDNPYYEKIKPLKGKCYGYFHAILLPHRERFLIANLPGPNRNCHPVMRVIFHGVK